jgi:hypothetical protein
MAPRSIASGSTPRTPTASTSNSAAAGVMARAKMLAGIERTARAVAAMSNAGACFGREVGRPEAKQFAEQRWNLWNLKAKQTEREPRLGSHLNSCVNLMA